MNYMNYLRTLGLCLPNSRMEPQRWYMLISLHLKNLNKNKSRTKLLNIDKNYDKELGVDFPSSRF